MEIEISFRGHVIGKPAIEIELVWSQFDKSDFVLFAHWPFWSTSFDQLCKR